MLRRIPNRILWRHIGCLQSLTSLAAPETSSDVTSAAGVQHASTVQHVYQAGGGQSSRTWQAWPVMAGVAAAAAAWHAHGNSMALADAARPDKAWHTAAQAAAESAVSEAFSEALLDFQRSIAQHQQSSSSSTSGTTSHNEPERPAVSYDGHQLSVNIPLLHGVDLPVLLRAVQAGVDQLAANSRRVEQQQQSWLLSTQRVQHWQLRRLTGGKADSVRSQPPSGDDSRSSMQQLSVQVVVPLQDSSPHEASGSGSSGSRRGSSGGSGGSGSSSESDVGGAGHVQVAKAAPFTADELELLVKLVAAANKPGSGQGFGAPESYFSPWGLSNSPDRVLGSLDKLGGALMGTIFSELLQELQHGLDYDQEQQEQEQQYDWHSRMDRFFGGLSDRLGQGLEKQLGDEGSLEEQIHNLQQLLQRELKAMAPPDVIEWLHDLTDQEQDQRGKQGLLGSDRDSHGPEQLQPQQQQIPYPSRRGSSRGKDDGEMQAAPKQEPQEPLSPWQQPSAQAAMRQLEGLGAAVYLPSAAALKAGVEQGDQEQQQWGVLAGYEAQKQALEDCLLLPLKHPEVYERVSARTRASAKAGGARPRAVLFEGPPGTGKTSTARVLAGRASLPLVYVPLESLVSKWYGESEQNMAKIFKACEALGGCIIFLDELDSLATSRDQGDMHEASRRLLGVLLREIDGFNHRDSGSSSSDGSGGDSSKRSVVIGATNRRQDLDAALLSRFDLSIHFGLPDEPCRAAILQQYAHQLTQEQRQQIAAVTQGFSGRDLRDVCEQTERAWASKIIRGQVEAEQLPDLPDYLAAVQQRREGAGRVAAVQAGSHTWA